MIQKRIKNYLQDDTFKEEFSHTILHKMNVFEEFQKIKMKLAQGSADENSVRNGAAQDEEVKQP